jgi:hypothetical protein
MKRSRRLLALVAVLCLWTACSEEPISAPPAGALFLHLATPHADDGAVIFVITGPSIDSVTVDKSSLRLFTRSSGGTLAGIVVGAVDAGPIVRLHVPDVGAAAAYRAQVIEVADRQDALRGSLVEYAMTVTP